MSDFARVAAEFYLGSIGPRFFCGMMDFWLLTPARRRGTRASKSALEWYS